MDTTGFPYSYAAGDTPSPNINFSIGQADYDILYVSIGRRPNPNDTLIAYNSITKDRQEIGYYDNLMGNWVEEIAGDIEIAFWEEPDTDLKTWLQANATQVQ